LAEEFGVTPKTVETLRIRANIRSYEFVKQLEEIRQKEAEENKQRAAYEQLVQQAGGRYSQRVFRHPEQVETYGGQIHVLGDEWTPWQLQGNRKGHMYRVFQGRAIKVCKDWLNAELYSVNHPKGRGPFGGQYRKRLPHKPLWRSDKNYYPESFFEVSDSSPITWDHIGHPNICKKCTHYFEDWMTIESEHIIHPPNNKEKAQ